MKCFRRVCHWMLIWTWILVSANLFAQEKQPLTVQWIYSDESRKVTALPSFTWVQDGTVILYDTRVPVEDRRFEKLDPRTGRHTTLLKISRALQNLKELLGEDAPKRLSWPLAWDRYGKRALYMFKNDIFVLELPAGKFIRVTQTDEKEKNPGFSPDGNKVAFVRDNDLYYYDLKQHKEYRLTHDGSENILNGTLSWVYWEEIFGRRDIAYWWSGDSKAIAYLQTDQSPVSVMYFVDYRSVIPKLIKQRYPKAGTENPRVRVGIVELDHAKTTWVDLSAFPHEYVVRVKWLPDNKRVSVQTMSRDQTELDLFFAERTTGKVTHILKETDPGWVNIHDDLYFLKNGKYFIWASERTGYAHLYRYRMDGTLVNQITRGNWAIRSSGGGVFWLRQAVTHIDEKNGWIYFTALKKSSVERHLYRIHMDGSGLQRLTKEEGFHSISFSPDGRYYFDRFSNNSTTPILSLHSNTGKRLQEVAKSKQELLNKFDFQYYQIFTIPARDGFAMPAQMLKPSNFDPHKKYPVIVYVYGGPSAPVVMNAWQSSIYFDNILVQNGFLVLRVDNRCATAISKKLENTILHQMYDGSELNDLLDAVHWLKSQSYVDPDRVGIWGWSGGGMFTLLAMTHSQEFKAGIAVAAVTNWRFYDTKWTETGMKLPEDNPEGYEKTDLTKTAKDLHGRLLLVHGTYDDNVHPQNAWSFVDELIKAGKMFDMMIYPMRKHGISDRPARIHLFNKMLEFWKNNL